MQERQPMSEVIKETIDKVKSLADTKTVIGEPMTLIEGVTIVPVSRVSIGAGIGGGEYGAKKDRKKEQTEKVIYTIDGRRVQKAEKGVYVINGKKVVVK